MASLSGKATRAERSRSRLNSARLKVRVTTVRRDRVRSFLAADSARRREAKRPNTAEPLPDIAA